MSVCVSCAMYCLWACLLPDCIPSSAALFTTTQVQLPCVAAARAMRSLMSCPQYMQLLPNPCMPRSADLSTDQSHCTDCNAFTWECCSMEAGVLTVTLQWPFDLIPCSCGFASCNHQPQQAVEQVCLVSSDLLHTHLALAGMYSNNSFNSSHWLLSWGAACSFKMCR